VERGIAELAERQHGVVAVSQLIGLGLSPRAVQGRAGSRSRTAPRSHSLPKPVVNGWIQLDGIGFEPDFLWPAAMLIAETDGGATHRTRRAFEDGPSSSEAFGYPHHP
jgi:hypothetical protein